jgi:hypothetical protein
MSRMQEARLPAQVFALSTVLSLARSTAKVPSHTVRPMMTRFFEIIFIDLIQHCDLIWRYQGVSIGATLLNPA